MAHELEIGGIENRIEAAFALTPGWHGLGRVLENVPDSITMLRESGLDWHVSMRPIADPTGYPVEGFKGTYRDDTNKSLGVVSEKYQIVQNVQAFDFLDSLLQDGIMRYESAGAIRGGRIVWVLGRMPTVDVVAADDTLNRYVLFTTSHDGKACLHAIPTSVRVVCANTYRAAIGDNKGYRHSGDMGKKLELARQYISQFDEAFTLYRDSARKLVEMPIGSESAKRYVQTLFPPVNSASGKRNRSMVIRDNKVQKIRDNWRSERQQMPSIKGSWWAMFNSVTEFVDHQSSFKGEGRERKENRMISTLDGDGADFKNKAFGLAVEMSGINNKTVVTV